MFWRRPTDREQDFERELRAHLELEAEEQAENASVEEARYAAMRAFGNTATVTEEVRAVWKWMALDNIARDFRYALHWWQQAGSSSVIARIRRSKFSLYASRSRFSNVNIHGRQ